MHTDPAQSSSSLQDARLTWQIQITQTCVVVHHNIETLTLIICDHFLKTNVSCFCEFTYLAFTRRVEMYTVGKVLDTFLGLDKYNFRMTQLPCIMKDITNKHK